MRFSCNLFLINCFCIHLNQCFTEQGWLAYMQPLSENGDSSVRNDVHTPYYCAFMICMYIQRGCNTLLARVCSECSLCVSISLHSHYSLHMFSSMSSMSIYIVVGCNITEVSIFLVNLFLSLIQLYIFLNSETTKYCKAPVDCWERTNFR